MPIDSVDQGFITGTGWKPQPSDSFARWVFDAGWGLDVSVLSLWVSACGLSTEGNSGFLTVGWLASHSECPKEKEQGGSCVLLLSILCHVLVPGLCLAYDRCPRNIFEMRGKKKIYIYIYIFYKIYRRIFL